MSEEALLNTLNKIAEKRGAQVMLETITIKGKPFTEYVLSKKRPLGLGKKILARAYMEYGFCSEEGSYSEITISKVPELSDNEFSNLERDAGIRVNLEDYKTAKKHNFNRRLGGPTS